jgi:hypothetical protein
MPAMSLFSWLFPTPKKRAPKTQPDSSGLSRMEATRPVGKSADGASNGQPANRKNERMVRRELLYTVVRDAMMRAGVLSASYKFKVLSLDARGRQFLVMVDLARDYGGETSRLAEIEAMIAQGAKSRHDILVTAVYWRMNEHVAVGDPAAQVTKKPAQAAVSDSQPMPLDSMPAVLESAPAPLEALAEPQAPLVAQPASSQRAPSRYDPIRADEVEAFKKALAEGAANPAAVAAAAVGVAHGASAKAFDGSNMHGPQSYTLLTGFEDTEMPDAKAPALSGTQYGELR